MPVNDKSSFFVNRKHRQMSLYL